MSRAATARTDIGLVIGSGLSSLALDVAARTPVDTPYGRPSSPLLTARLAGRHVLALARHGEDLSIAPHEVNYRANLWAMHRHGVRRCIGVNVVGTIAAEFRPGDLAVPDQLIDYTWGRPGSFAGDGRPLVYVEFAEPFSTPLREQLARAARECGIPLVAGGIYGVTQGPRLETVAEIDRLERDGCAMVGMTALPEAALARELGIDYAICALAVNYAAGKGPSLSGIHDQIQRHMTSGMERVARVLERVVVNLSGSAL